jgi:hypothetical protein
MASSQKETATGKHSPAPTHPLFSSMPAAASTHHAPLDCYVPTVGQAGEFQDGMKMPAYPDRLNRK